MTEVYPFDGMEGQGKKRSGNPEPRKKSGHAPKKQCDVGVLKAEVEMVGTGDADKGNCFFFRLISFF